MLLIQNCNLVNMAGIYEQRRDLLVEGTKVREIADKIEPSRAGRLSTRQKQSPMAFRRFIRAPAWGDTASRWIPII